MESLPLGVVLKVETSVPRLAHVQLNKGSLLNRWLNSHSVTVLQRLEGQPECSIPSATYGEAWSKGQHSSVCFPICIMEGIPGKEAEMSFSTLNAGTPEAPNTGQL